MTDATILDIPRPAWVNQESYRGAVEHDGVTWAWTESDYRIGLGIDVPFREAEGSNGESHILHWWTHEPYTMEHFRRFVTLGFPSPAGSNWTAAQIDEAYEERQGVIHPIFYHAAGGVALFLILCIMVTMP